MNKLFESEYMIAVISLDRIAFKFFESAMKKFIADFGDQ